MNVDVFYNMIDVGRNIYELAELFPQNRYDISHFIHILKCNNCDGNSLESSDLGITCTSCNTSFQVKNNIVNFINNSSNTDKWSELNEQFLSYHKSLTPYTFLNAAPFINYLSYKSGIGNLKNIKVLDVGGGTGHTLCSFFQYPETIDYYLIDPNIRLLHDQFVRVYPKLLELKISHFCGYAEKLHFQNKSFDLVISLSSIDHYRDYHKFMYEAYEVLKPGGILFIASHLDKKSPMEKSLASKLFTRSLPERIVRYLYAKKNKVEKDTHTFHFENSKPIVETMEKSKFEIVQNKEFMRYFFITGKKLQN